MRYLFLLLLLTACRPSRNSVYVKDITNSRWHVIYENPGFGHVEYDVVFLPGGKLFNDHPNEATPDNDRWSQKGNTVEMRFNDNFAIYKGRLTDATHMNGTAQSSTGGDWEWSAELISKSSAN